MASKGYQGFGSFHNEVSVQDMIAIPADEYDEPKCLVDEEQLLEKYGNDLEFGENMRNRHFFLDSSWTFVNHGAFGAACKIGLNCAQEWQIYAESQPLKFIDRELFNHLVKSTRRMASFVHADPREVVLLPNVTTGLNTVIRSCGISEGDCVYMLDIGYGSVKKMLEHVCNSVGAEVIMQHVSFPLHSEDDLVELVSRTLPSTARLAVFDHITSNTAICMPVAKLVEVCHSRGVPVLIDGAHALGMLDLDIPSIGADYYVSNCHKWLCCPKGTAMMYVSSSKQTSLDPLIISHGFGSGFHSNFIWDGCRDYSGALALPTVLKWWDLVDLTKARMYCRQLIRDAIAMLTEAWSTDTLCPQEMYSHMALVRIPDASVPADTSVAEASDGTYTSTHAKIVQDKLHFKYKIEVPAKCVQGRLYLRISACVYNEHREYETLRDAILDIASSSSCE